MKIYGWKIVDTIHPSELMGKGFQVGDKVLIPPLWVEKEITSIDENGIIEVNQGARVWYAPHQLKPVLPVEEEEKNYHFSVNLNGLKIMADDLLPPNTFIIDNGKEQLRFKFEDGKIVNL